MGADADGSCGSSKENVTEPKNKRGESKQDYGTPWEFIRAVEKRFGKLTIDLAASADNSKAPVYIPEELDSLTQDWVHAIGDGIGWLNPPFGKIEPWAKKCFEWKKVWNDFMTGGNLLFFTPASVGSNWFAEYVEGHALVIPVRPRLVFEGMLPNPKTGKVDPFPKDLMLSVFGDTRGPASPSYGFETWDWRNTTE